MCVKYVSEQPADHRGDSGRWLGARRDHRRSLGVQAPSEAGAGHGATSRAERCEASRSSLASSCGDGRTGRWRAISDCFASDFGVSFPGCVTAGRDLDEARRMAAEALSLHIAGMIEDRDALPAPSSLELVMAEPENRDAVAVLIDGPAPSVRAVRINMTIEDRLLEQIDRVSRNRSLADVAREELTRELASVMHLSTRRYRFRRHEDLFFLERKNQRTPIRLASDRSRRLRPNG